MSGPAQPEDGPGSPAELFRRIRRLEITARRLVAEQFAGSYHSVFKGRGIEFAQIREYVAGDDVRMIDANASARFGRPFVKLFTEERQLTVMLVVDVSASMRFGTRERLKRQLAAEFCAAIAFAAITNNDQVGLILFGEEPERIIPPKKGRRHILRLLHELLRYEPATRGTRVDRALETAARLMGRAGTIFVVSDYLGPVSPETLHQFRALGKRHDVTAVCVRDRTEFGQSALTRVPKGQERDPRLPPVEPLLPAEGLWQMEDPESGRTLVVDLSHPPTRRAVADRLAKLDASNAAALRRTDVDTIDLVTDGSLVEPLLAFFRRRARHLRQGV